MKRLKHYLRKSSLPFILALIIGFVGKMSMNYFSTAVSAYTESLIISYAREVVEQGVTEGIIELLDGKSILNEVYDEHGKVCYAYLDVKTLNHIRNNVSKYVTNCIETINQGEKIKSIELPLGYFFGRNYFLSNGIKIPIDLEVIGHQKVEFEKTVDSYGLNTTILQININVSLSIRSVIPFQANTIEATSSIPVALEIMNNDIPYYLGDII